MKPSLWLKLAPGLVLLGLAFGTFFLFAVGIIGEERSSPRRREGSFLVPAVFIDFFYWTIAAPGKAFVRRGTNPLYLTYFTLAVSLVAGVLLAVGEFLLGFWVLVLTAAGDSLDGFVARNTGTASPRGAFLDSYLDRVAEAALYGGIAYYGSGTLLTGVAFWVFVASVCVSYARARGEGLGTQGEVGLMQRAERMILFIFTLLVALTWPFVSFFLDVPGVPEAGADPGAPDPFLLLFGFTLLAVLTSVTAIRRGISIAGQLPGQNQNPSGENEGNEKPDTASAGSNHE